MTKQSVLLTQTHLLTKLKGLVSNDPRPFLFSLVCCQQAELERFAFEPCRQYLTLHETSFHLDANSFGSLAGSRDCWRELRR